jgi:hypothetical protein
MGDKHRLPDGAKTLAMVVLTWLMALSIWEIVRLVYRIGKRWALLLILLLAISAPSHAAPPPGADPNSEIGQWFRSLRQPGTAAPCCSLADCHMTDYRIGKDGYEALVVGRWIPIPRETILRTSNPTGRAVVCATVAPVLQYRAAITIRCFVTPGEP